MTKVIKKDSVKAIASSGADRPVNIELVDPEIVAAYAQVLPSAPERILKMTENQLCHQHWNEKARTIAKYLRPLLGIIFAMTITLLCFVASIVSVFLGQGIAATVFFGFTLLGIISRFINGTDNK